MKLASAILVSVLSMSANAQSNPVVDAECSAVFKGMSMILEKNSPELSLKARNASLRLKARSEAVLGVSTATRYYVMKMDDMTADLRANGGTGIRENDMKFCAGVAKSYGML